MTRSIACYLVVTIMGLVSSQGPQVIASPTELPDLLQNSLKKPRIRQKQMKEKEAVSLKNEQGLQDNPPKQNRLQVERLPHHGPQHT